jgi:LmbE family N-acetylglucosaminyl deacetylase
MRVMVISVHPDDETLGCGGALLKHKSKGDEIYCVFVTSGNKEQSKLIPKLNDLYEFTKSYKLELPELKLGDISLNEIIPKISSIFKEVEPELLFIPNRCDVHSDHRKTFEALIATTKSFRYPYIQKILMCEVLSETDFILPLPENIFAPNVFYDITNFYKKKIEILKIFESELFERPMTRSIDTVSAHNRFRGSRIGVEYAEAFMLLYEKA